MSKLYKTWDALLFIQCAVMIVGNVFYTWFIQNDTFTTPLKCKNFYMTCILVILYITMIHNSARGHYFLKKKIDIYYHKIRIFRGLNTLKEDDNRVLCRICDSYIIYEKAYPHISTRFLLKNWALYDNVKMK